MRRFWTMWLLIGCAALFAGCRGRSDLIEAELRYRDRQLRESEAERTRLAELNQAFEASLRGPNNCPPGVGCGGNAQHHIKDVQVARGTGGLDEDKCPGDEGIMVVIAPRDGDESVVKANGQARITALQLTPEGLKLPLSTWDVSSAYLRRNWKTGLLSSGYYVALPWQVVPQSEKIRVVVQFQTPDGAFFEGERDIQVRLPHAPPAGTTMPAGVTPPAATGVSMGGPPTCPAPILDGPMPPLPTGPDVFPTLPPPTPLPYPVPEGPVVNSMSSYGPRFHAGPVQLWRPVARQPVILGPVEDR